MAHLHCHDRRFQLDSILELHRVKSEEECVILVDSRPAREIILSPSGAVGVRGRLGTLIR